MNNQIKILELKLEGLKLQRETVYNKAVRLKEQLNKIDEKRSKIQSQIAKLEASKQKTVKKQTETSEFQAHTA